MVRSIREGQIPPRCRVVILAEPTLFDAACSAGGVAPLMRCTNPASLAALAGPDPVLFPVTPAPVPATFTLGTPSPFTGRVAGACVEAAARLALAGHVDAVVTAPLAKSALKLAGIPFPGHTEYLASLAAAPSVAMMFVTGNLRLTLATIHIPLAEVPRHVTRAKLLETYRLTREGLRRYLRLAEPRLAVLGLNPHAGEEGMFGNEEIDVVAPSIAEAKAKGWNVAGPFPADSFFFRKAAEFDGVIALYHDQGLIPVKLLSQGRAVNVTLGLPFLRTSVDHGTAFDLAGKGMADSGSLVAAAELAASWTRASAPAA